MTPSMPKTEFESLQADWERDGRLGRLLGRSAPMRALYEQIVRVAATGVSVLITGESGSGKEVVAHTIHDLSQRRSRPFLAVNCGAISPNLIESELFGHEKGSFTGADRQHLGFFERAHDGTLFLDEIAEMPLELQVKLLRVLESGTFTRVGSTELQRCDVRIIAATNRSPEQAVASDKLRGDLLYRLNVFPIRVPPLRERLDDVPLLAAFFLDAMREQEGREKAFAPPAVRRLTEYRWPGNVRELHNAVQFAYVMAPGDEIGEEWLPASIDAIAGGLPSPDGVVPALTVPLGTSVPELQRQLIVATLHLHGNHRERTAAALGISLKTLYNRLKDYGPGADQPKDDGGGGGQLSGEIAQPQQQ